MENRIKIEHFKKTYLLNILDDIVDPTYHHLKQNSDIFESFENQLKAYDLKHKHMYITYTFFATDGTILQDLVNDLHTTLCSFGVDEDLHRSCAKNTLALYKDFLNKRFSLDENELKQWDAKLQELESICVDGYKRLVTDSKHDSSDQLDGLDLNSCVTDEKKSASEFMAQGEFDDNMVVEVEELIAELQEYLDAHYQEGLTQELVQNYKDLIMKMVGFYELSGEFRTLVYPMNNLYAMLQELDIASLDGMMQDVMFNFLSNTVSDLRQWIHEVLIDQKANDIHYLDASLLANISQMEMMISGEEDDDDDDDILF